MPLTQVSTTSLFALVVLEQGWEGIVATPIRFDEAKGPEMHTRTYTLCLYLSVPVPVPVSLVCCYSGRGEWECHAGTGSVPTRRQGHAMCSAEGGAVFLHGGLHDGTFHDDLYELNTGALSFGYSGVWHAIGALIW